MANGNDPTDPFRSNAEPEPVPIRSDWARSERPSIDVVEAVATATDREPTDVPPLFEYVDPDALDALVTAGKDGFRCRVRVSFQFDGVAVIVDSHDGIVVLPGTADSE